MEEIKMTKVKNLKKAVGDYKRANSEGAYSPRYGYLMFDAEDCSVWTDEFFSIGHNAWKEYHSNTIINLGHIMAERGLEVNMANVRFVVEKIMEKRGNAND